VIADRSQLESPVHRAPAVYKLGLTLIYVLGMGALPARHPAWALMPAFLLLLVIRSAKLPIRRLLAGLALSAPLLFGVAAFGLFQTGGARIFLGLMLKSALSMLAVQVLAKSTSVSDLLRAMKQVRMPEALCSTIALLHRYSFLLADESKRMRRARAGRTLSTSRWQLWRALGNSVGLLFVRSIVRAERVSAAMRSRGAA
jgi:cobalt/nickel transport system permease protein